MSDHHHHHDGPTGQISVAVVTVTTSRDAESDESGAVAREAIEAAGHDVVDSAVVSDDESAIRESVETTEADAIVTTGGTGLTPDDVTVDALRAVFDREIPGFGEYVRRLSHEEIGTPAMLSRTTAGVVGGTVVYALPGSPDAVALALEEAVLPELEHTVGLVDRE
jgi:molybdenum cofactor biosynthesis protein B